MDAEDEDVVFLTRNGVNRVTLPMQPTPDRTLKDGDVVYVAGRRECLSRFERECGRPPITSMP
jgi:Trk K+ transport system NAD-binding subunit